MKRIFVQGKLSIAAAIAISTVVIIVGLIFAYFAFTLEDVSASTRSRMYEFIGLIAIFVPLWINNARSKEAYVSEMLLTDRTLTLVYRNREQGDIVIDLDNIKSIHAKLEANNVRTSRSSTLFCETNVTIQTKTGKFFHFSENPTANLFQCSYAFLLRLIDNSRFLPNFTYEIQGNSEETKEDIKYYAQYGKRLPWYKMLGISLKKVPIFIKILLGASLLGFFSCMFMLAYLNFPTFTSETDKEYVSYIEQGYKYFQDDNYNRSMVEYDKAMAIHNDDPVLYERRVWTLKRAKKYEEAVEEAKIGISYIGKKSPYNAAKKYRFDTKEDIALYTTLGECLYKLKRYQEAEDAYDYVIKYSHYTYSDMYFERGRCRYYLLKKDAALEDFNKHKEIIEKYLEDQKTTEYPDMYPRYDQKNLENINLWIKACYKYL